MHPEFQAPFAGFSEQIGRHKLSHVPASARKAGASLSAVVESRGKRLSTWAAAWRVQRLLVEVTRELAPLRVPTGGPSVHAVVINRGTTAGKIYLTAQAADARHGEALLAMPSRHAFSGTGL
jgi:hypothetical protein